VGDSCYSVRLSKYLGWPKFRPTETLAEFEPD
jgi:hypothetical protein